MWASNSQLPNRPCSQRSAQVGWCADYQHHGQPSAQVAAYGPAHLQRRAALARALQPAQRQQHGHRAVDVCHLERLYRPPQHQLRGRRLDRRHLGRQAAGRCIRLAALVPPCCVLLCVLLLADLVCGPHLVAALPLSRLAARRLLAALPLSWIRQLGGWHVLLLAGCCLRLAGGGRRAGLRAAAHQGDRL